MYEACHNNVIRSHYLCISYFEAFRVMTAKVAVGKVAEREKWEIAWLKSCILIAL